MKDRLLLDSMVKESLKRWPQRPPGLKPRRGKESWLRGRPSEDAGITNPFLKLPGTTKLRTVLQPLMRKHDIDMWIIISRENGPDPALELFGGNGITGWYGHRNAYIFYDPGGTRPLQTVAIGTHLSGHLRAFYDSIVPFRDEGLNHDGPPSDRVVMAVKPD